MENDKVTIALAVAHWQALLDALGHAPHIIVNSVGLIVNEIQLQAGPQIDEIQKRAAEAAAAAEPAEPSSDVKA